MEKGTDTFEQALEDLKEILSRGGLAQDTTTNDSFKTRRSLVDNVIRIGGQEGLTNDFITDSINKLLEPQRQRLDNLTLMDCLSYKVLNLMNMVQ